MTTSRSTRREFLTGRVLGSQIAAAQDALADSLLAEREQPTASSTIRLAMRAMACEFGVLLHPEKHVPVWLASDALERVAAIEQRLTVYRSDSELSRLNSLAATTPFVASRELFSLLERCADLTKRTGGAFDASTQSQILLWQQCRAAERLPTPEAVERVLEQSGMQHVRLDSETGSVSLLASEIGFNLGAIGKGYAVDQTVEALDAAGIGSCLVHGGQSSLFARGPHGEHVGWPVGIGNPLFTSKRLGTLLLCNQGMGTSGSNIQFFRYQGQRYGHILDPRTAWPAAELLSAVVVAPSAELADSLSTAFFVLGVEKALVFCNDNPLIGAILIPVPRNGTRLTPYICNLQPEQLFLDPDQVL